MSRKPAKIDDAFLAELLDDDDLLETAGLLALDAPPQRPSAELEDRLSRSLRETHRFDDLEELVASLLDLPRAAVAPLLVAVDDPASWEAGPSPGVDLFHVDGGPAVANAVTGFVRMPPGVRFPQHRHIGDEVVLILQGSCVSGNGRDGTEVFVAGDLVRMGAGTEHELEAQGEVRLLYLAIIHEGVVIEGETMLPGDPRA